MIVRRVGAFADCVRDQYPVSLLQALDDLAVNLLQTVIRRCPATLLPTHLSSVLCLLSSTYYLCLPLACSLYPLYPNPLS